MLYLATPSGPDVRAAMRAGRLGCMTTPAQHNVLPHGAAWAADNGRFGKGWPGHEPWHAWLARTAARYDPALCRFALAPDVPYDAHATLTESLPWLPLIRDLALPAAFAAQNGSEHIPMPWDEFDVLFLAGDTAWKLGPAAQRLAAEAASHGKSVHMGRVNSLRRLRIAAWFGCASADGTYLAYGPDINLRRLEGWLREIHRQPTLMDRDPDPGHGAPASGRNRRRTLIREP